MKVMLLIVGGLLLSVVLLIAWASAPWSLSAQKIQGEMITVEPDSMMDVDERPSVIKIMTWNISWLYGAGSEGPGYEYRQKEIFDEKMKTLIQEIKLHSPDVLCLQEIDFHSHRTHNINQATVLAKATGYPYVAIAPSWVSNYIPFPSWPMSRNFGSMNSGGAILSRYPILSQEVTLLKKPLANPWWYNIFYLHRYFQKVVIEFGDKKFKLLNLHLEAFDKEDRKSQIQELVSVVKGEQLDFVAGDFNMLPKNATKRSKFFNADEYENDPSADLMQTSGLLEVIPDQIYDKNESLYFTFPAWKPDRRLDYIFYRSGLKMMKAEIFTSALSDHLPLKATFQIDSPRFNPYSQ